MCNWAVVCSCSELASSNVCNENHLDMNSVNFDVLSFDIQRTASASYNVCCQVCSTVKSFLPAQWQCI